MEKYTMTIKIKGWVNGSGWDYDDALEDVRSDDYMINNRWLSSISPDELREIELSHSDWGDIIFDGMLEDYDEADLINLSHDEAENDLKCTVKIYLTADYEDDPDEATPIFTDSIWQSAWLEEAGEDRSDEEDDAE